MNPLTLLIPRSLTNRVYALYSVTLGLVFVTGLVMFLSYQYRQQVEETQRGSVTTIEVTAQAIQDSVVIGDYDTLRRILERSVQGSVFSSGTFIDLSGGRIVADSREKVSNRPPPWFVEWVDSRFTDENRPITVGGRDYGVLRLHFDSNYVASELWGLSLMALTSALGFLLLGLVVMRLLLKRSLASLDRLQAFEHDIAAGVFDASRLDASDAPDEFERIFSMVRRTAELVRERERSRRALDNQKFALDQHAIVSITDLAGNITYANDRFCEITGYEREELLGKNHRIINSGEHSPEFFVDLWRTIASGHVWHGEICNHTRDGRRYWVNATIVPLFDEAGQPEQYIAIRTDITDRKQIEASLLAAKEAAEQANRAKSQFLANMSHEIRTPLNAVLGMLRLLRATALSAQQNDYVQKTESAARSLLQLLNDILDFSKIEAEKLTLEARPLHIDRLLRELSVILSASVGPKPVEVLFDIDPRLPRTLMGDELRLQQVLINLGGNAIKFTERGEVVVSVRVVRSSPTDALLRFAVRDTGIGIAPEKQARIFDGFSQAEASTTRRYGGTGLGLTICQRLVSLMGGHIELDSAPGRGSTFAFEVALPLFDASSGAQHTSAPVSLEDMDRLGELRALIVDDNDTARSLLAEMARSLGWQVDVAATGFEGVQLARRAAQARQPYDVAFVDWQMPGMDGLETSLQLRQGEEGGPALVMLVTAHGREMLSHCSPQQQAALGGFLVKPVTASMLFDAVVNARMGTTNTAAPSVQSPSQRRLEGLRLLVVEDNANNRQVAQELLVMEGAVVDLAEDGEQGVQAVLTALHPYDAVLMDVQMPVLDGFGATARIRAEGLRRLPIIAMTANAMASDREDCLAAGMNDHVGKPFDLDLLVAKLLAQVGRAAALAAPARVSASSGALPDAALARAAAAGLDLARAVARIGGRSDVYARMLRVFCEDLPTQCQSMQRAMAAGRRSEVAASAHTIKGTGGMLGSEAVYDAAAALEATCRNAPPPSGDPAPALLERLQAVAQPLLNGASAVVDALQAHATMPAPLDLDPHAPADLTALRAALGELAEALQASDMRALALTERLAARFEATPGDRLSLLQTAVAALDFDEAGRQCRRWLKDLA